MRFHEILQSARLIAQNRTVKGPGMHTLMSDGLCMPSTWLEYLWKSQTAIKRCNIEDFSFRKLRDVIVIYTLAVREVTVQNNCSVIRLNLGTVSA